MLSFARTTRGESPHRALRWLGSRPFPPHADPTGRRPGPVESSGREGEPESTASSEIKTGPRRPPGGRREARTVSHARTTRGESPHRALRWLGSRPFPPHADPTGRRPGPVESSGREGEPESTASSEIKTGPRRPPGGRREARMLSFARTTRGESPHRALPWLGSRLWPAHLNPKCCHSARTPTSYL